MTDTLMAKEHFNLYYIFEQDKKEHPMAEAQIKMLRKKIFDSFDKKIKPNKNTRPP